MPDEKAGHQHGWHFGYVTCSCGWARDARADGTMDTERGLALFADHKMRVSDDPITEDWLRSVGYRWHEFERSGGKHWVLWMASAFADGFTGSEDLGLVLCAGRTDDTWFCWLRGDYSHLYSRFIHVRHLRYQREVVHLVEACTGLDWTPANHLCGQVMTQKQADWGRKESERLDLRLMRERRKWREIEEDGTRGGALPEHMQHAVDAGKAK